jgi:hypothetical protein
MLARCRRRESEKVITINNRAFADQQLPHFTFATQVANSDLSPGAAKTSRFRFLQRAQGGPSSLRSLS